MSRGRLAMDPPRGDIFLLEEGFVAKVLEASRQSPRRCIIAPLHRTLVDQVGRSGGSIRWVDQVGRSGAPHVERMQPGTYVQPHRHKAPPKAESWIILRGAVALFPFRDDGAVDGSRAR